LKKILKKTVRQVAAKAARQALDLVKENVERYAIDCGYEEKTGYVYAQTDKQQKELQDILEASLNAGWP
jgi:hypothetical protein